MLPITERRDRLQGFERLCREHGLALTVQRREVFAAMLERRDHPTAEQIYAKVKGRVPGVSRTTVYRVLETLVGAGVITKACHPGAAARYDPLTRRHHHLVCLHCEKVVDLEDPVWTGCRCRASASVVSSSATTAYISAVSARRAARN
jgi:Fur family peroxide stress response transcriptional regulator